MNIDEGMVKKKEIVGKRADGSPVVMIVTHGGLFAFFCKDEKGDIETLSLAAHKGIASFFAEKKARDIKWNEDFNKSQSDTLEDLKKSDSNYFVKLRNALFSKAIAKSEKSKSDYYIVYDTKKIIIGIMHKKEIQEELDSGSLYKESLVRPLELTSPVEFISQCKEFKVG